MTRPQAPHCSAARAVATAEKLGVPADALFKPMNAAALTARPAQLEVHVARMTSDEPTLSDIASVLYLISTADEADVVRIRSLCLLASRALGKFDPDTRCAPPAELAEVVRDARQSCGAAHLGCTEHVHSWIFDGTFCSPTCRADHMRSQGEVWAD